MSDQQEQQPSSPPTDRQSRRQGIPPNGQQWNSPPLPAQDDYSAHGGPPDPDDWHGHSNGQNGQDNSEPQSRLTRPRNVLTVPLHRDVTVPREQRRSPSCYTTTAPFLQSIPRSNMISINMENMTPSLHCHRHMTPTASQTSSATCISASAVLLPGALP